MNKLPTPNLTPITAATLESTMRLQNKIEFFSEISVFHNLKVCPKCLLTYCYFFSPHRQNPLSLSIIHGSLLTKSQQWLTNNKRPSHQASFNRPHTIMLCTKSKQAENNNDFRKYVCLHHTKMLFIVCTHTQLISNRSIVAITIIIAYPLWFIAVFRRIERNYNVQM